VANSGGSFACLPLASGVVMATLTPMATAADESKVRVLLIGIRLAAYSAWGAGS